ncbi:MAG: nicotinate phosphoribosyltransferase [Nitrospinae bacterium]|nr:nicotinate phosphoribosyltransferase [Nitrospinota bacterium]
MSAPPSALFTDLYQLTMMQGYLQAGLGDEEACFDLFFRTNPFGGGYTVFAGLEDALEYLASLHFTDEDIAYLHSLKIFSAGFLDYLRRFRFNGEVYSHTEGSIVFPLEPVLRVKAPLFEAQLVETALLNIVNFQSLIATKSARICHEAGEDRVVEFGLRRAQGVDGGITAAKAAYIGGCSATSNVHAGKIFGIPVKGTHAHSWVTAFPDELSAFRKFVEIYPVNPILLVDTYDTLKSGIPNAITVGQEMKERGGNLFGVRLDSGDLAFLSVETRRMLDSAGLADVKIVCSNELDEHIIHDLGIQGARIDLYGVGTRLVTAHGEPATSGVYKLAAIRRAGEDWRMKLKFSEGMKKASLPGVKQVYRMSGADGAMMADLIELENGEPDFSAGVWGFHPAMEYHRKFYSGVAAAQPLLTPAMVDGVITASIPPLAETRDRVKRELDKLHPTVKRLLNPHIYKVSLGPRLNTATKKLREELAR